jgi:hypothetical protein
MTAPVYADAAAIKAVMPDVPWGTSYNTILGVLATRVSRMIDKACIRQPGEFATGTAGSVRYFDGSGNACLWVDEMAGVPSLVEVAEVGDLTNYTAWASNDYMVWPYNNPPYTRLDIDLMRGVKALWTRYPRSVKITAPWGFSTTVPEDLEQAVITQVVRWFKRGQQGFSDVGAIAELGQLRYVQKLDPDVEMILDSPGYVRRTI